MNRQTISNPLAHALPVLEMMSIATGWRWQVHSQLSESPSASWTERLLKNTVVTCGDWVILSDLVLVENVPISSNFIRVGAGSDGRSSVSGAISPSVTSRLFWGSWPFPTETHHRAAERPSERAAFRGFCGRPSLGFNSTPEEYQIRIQAEEHLVGLTEELVWCFLGSLVETES